MHHNRLCIQIARRDAPIRISARSRSTAGIRNSVPPKAMALTADHCLILTLSVYLRLHLSLSLYVSASHCLLSVTVCVSLSLCHLSVGRPMSVCLRLYLCL